MSGRVDIKKTSMKGTPTPRVMNRLLITRSGFAMSQAELARNSGVARQTINADDIFYLYEPKR